MQVSCNIKRLRYLCLEKNIFNLGNKTFKFGVRRHKNRKKKEERKGEMKERRKGGKFKYRARRERIRRELSKP